jgi:Mrp family chromosome partitioning ATPase
MQVSDAVLLSTMVDGVVLVVDSRATPRQIDRKTCSRLGYTGAKILGVVLNRLSMRRGDYTDAYRYYCTYDPMPEREAK